MRLLGICTSVVWTSQPKAITMGAERIILLGLFIVIFGVAFNNGLKLPSYIKGCSRHDPKLNECALKSARQMFATTIPVTGDRKYHVPILDPLVITELNIDQAGLILNYQDLKMYGLKHVNLKAINIDLKQLRAQVDFVVPELKMASKYVIKGRILVLPLSGKGDVNMTLSNVIGSMSQKFSLVTGKNGKQHLMVTNGVLVTELSGFKTSMSGLFNGDKRLGDHTNLFINENWREVVQELKPSFNAALAKVADQVFNNLATAVPYNELFLDTV